MEKKNKWNKINPRLYLSLYSRLRSLRNRNSPAVICAPVAEASIIKSNFYKGSFARAAISFVPCQLVLDHRYLRAANAPLALVPCQPRV